MSSAAVVIGALRANYIIRTIFLEFKPINKVEYQK